MNQIQFDAGSFQVPTFRCNAVVAWIVVDGGTPPALVLPLIRQL